MADQVLVAQLGVVSVADRIKLAQGSENPEIVLLVLWCEEHDVFGRSNEQVGDDREAPDDFESRLGADYRRDCDVEFGIRQNHSERPARSSLYSLVPEAYLRRAVVLDGYIRVSQVGGRKGDSFISPQVQREEIARWISSNGAQPGEMYEELDQSGGRADRPLLMEAIERIEAGISDGLVVARLSRFGRSLVDGMRLVERIQAAGATLVSVREGFDLGTSTGRLVAKVLFSVAEWELDTRREHWDDARRKRVERGCHICTVPPIGYLKSASGRLVIDPVAGPVIAELFQRRLAGALLVDLVDFLDDSPAVTHDGGAFYTPLVSRIISNPVYKGSAYSGSYFKVHAHEALVDPDTWQLCQATIRRPRRTRVEALLAGAIRCAGCGRAMSAVRGSGKHLPSNHYRCSAAKGSCPSPARASCEEIDPLVEDLLFRARSGGRRGQPSKRSEEAETAVALAEADLEAYRDNVGLARTLGAERFERGVDTRVHLLERRLLELGRVKQSQGIWGIDTRRLETAWPELTWEERRTALARVVELVVVEKGPEPVIERAWVYRRGQGPLIGPHRRLQFERPKEGAHRLSEPRLWPRKRVESQLREFAAELGTQWPSHAAFAGAGLGRLHAQILAWGGPQFWGPLVGLRVPSSITQWNERRIRGALRPLLEGRKRWPGRAEFREAGMLTLYFAVRDNGGFEYWAKQFGVAYLPQHWPRHPWPRSRIEGELREFCEGREDFPPRVEFRRRGRTALYVAAASHGGLSLWALQLGLRVSGDRNSAEAKGGPGTGTSHKQLGSVDLIGFN